MNLIHGLKPGWLPKGGHNKIFFESENAADFAGWLFLKRQAAMMEIIQDLKAS